jgi:REP element-mobilizing transposase RayT
MSYYKRRLPHGHPEEAWLFVTWRLAGYIARSTLPGKIIAKAGIRFVVLDREADRAISGPVWLNDSRIAQNVESAILAGEHQYSLYDLAAYAIMPNHVHIAMRPKVPLPVITRWLKGSTARYANLILGRTGQPFWLDESFDHRARSEAELQKIMRYIEQNPVSAGFVSSATDWPWSSARHKVGQAFPPAHSEE